MSYEKMKEEIASDIRRVIEFPCQLSIMAAAHAGSLMT